MLHVVYEKAHKTYFIITLIFCSSLLFYLFSFPLMAKISLKKIHNGDKLEIDIWNILPNM